jgi:hypothetical protein
VMERTTTLEDRHVGELLIRLDFEKVRGCVPVGTDVDALLANIQAGLWAALGKHFTGHELAWGEQFVKFDYGWEQPQIIKPREEAAADWEKAREELGAMMRQGDEQRKEAAAANPDNGKDGYWQVDGVRHDALVKASSEPEAIAKAIASGEVGDWESPSASFIGAELPERLR